MRSRPSLRSCLSPRSPAARAGVVGASLAAILTLAANAHATTPQPAAEIRAAAIAAIGAADAEAEAVIDPALRLARCSVPLQAVASGPRTAQVRCDDTPGWRLYVPVRVRREADVVVLTASAPAGVAIAAGQLSIQRRDVSRASGTTFTDPAALVGRIPNRALATGLVPTEADLSTGTPLRRGDPVVLVSRAGGVEVRMQGRALGPDRAGGLVSVENLSSHKVLRGRVTSPGVVEVIP